MKNFVAFLIAVLIVAVSSNFYFDGYKKELIAKYNPPEAKDHNVYDRVMENGIIRCGYVLWEPALMRDPQNGDLYGIYYDYMTALGHALDLQIEWTRVINPGTFLDDLNNGEFDLECSGGWPNAQRGKYVAYTTPIFFIRTQDDGTSAGGVRANALSLPAEEYRLRQIIDTATRQLLYEGEIDRILDKYHVSDKNIYRIRKPYILPDKSG